MPAVQITFTQEAFRGRNDDGDEATATWIAGLNENWDQAIGVPFRIRLLASRLNENTDQNGNMDLYVSHNGGTFVICSSTDGTSAAQDIGSSTLDAQGADTTQQLGSGTYLTNNNGVNNNNGNAFTEIATWFSGTAFEADFEFCLYLVPDLVAVGDTLEFRLRFNDTVFTGGYLNTPLITAINSARSVQLKGSTLRLKGNTLQLR